MCFCFLCISLSFFSDRGYAYPINARNGLWLEISQCLAYLPSSFFLYEMSSFNVVYPNSSGLYPSGLHQGIAPSFEGENAHIRGYRAMSAMSTELVSLG